MTVTTRYEFSGDDPVEVVLEAFRAAPPRGDVFTEAFGSAIARRRLIAEALVAYFDQRAGTDDRTPGQKLIDSGATLQWATGSPSGWVDPATDMLYEEADPACFIDNSEESARDLHDSVALPRFALYARDVAVSSERGPWLLVAPPHGDDQ